MNILITGGGGYLGSVLVPALLAVGYQVTVVDTFLHGIPSLIAHMYRRNLIVIRDDARSTATLRRAREYDVIIPLAALVGAPACDLDPVTAVSLNHIAVEDLIGKVSRDQTILFPCTNSGYGIGGGSLCTEDSPLMPVSLYGRTKVEAERAVLTHPRGVSLRLATLFGSSPRMRLDLLVNDFCYRAVRDRAIVLFEPEFRRNFLHVRDAASAFLFALQHERLFHGRIFNVGNTAANMTKRQLAEVVRAEVPGCEILVATTGADPDQRDYVVSNARIEALGWRPTNALHDGVCELVRTCRGMPMDRTPWRNA